MEFGKLKLKRCRYGWMLFAGPVIGKCFELYGQYSESEIMMMRAFLRPGDTVVDVGANIGDLTLPLAQFVGNEGRVYAIESHPYTFNVLCANLALNDIANVKPLNTFVTTRGDRDTASRQFGPDAYVSPTWETSFMVLDDLDLAAFNLLKIDVDGKELSVLQSGAMQIERFRPTLYLENDSRETSSPLLAYLLGLDYDLYWHLAPVFESDNYFGNPINHWPGTMISPMVVGVPSERKIEIPGLDRIRSPDAWWDPGNQVRSA